jgi:hypothetical protein
MNTIKFTKPHSVLIAVILVLVLIAAFVSRASTKAMERVIMSSVFDLMGSRVTDYRWEFLREGMVFGRMINADEAIYLLNFRLFGGDHRYALVVKDDVHPKAFMKLGTGPVSPHTERIHKVMRSYFGEALEDSTALDTIIAHTILTGIQTIAIHEHARKESHSGK